MTRNKTIKNQIFDYLSTKINNGNFKPREQIDERQICEDLAKHPKFFEWIENDELNFDYLKNYINNHLI